MSNNTKNIRIHEETWRELHSRKRPGESYDDVITRLLEQDPQTPTQPGTRNSHELPDNLDLPGSGDTLANRRKAIARMYRHLQQQGSATKAEFLELVDAEQVGYSSPESFWSNAVKGRDSLRSLPGVSPPAEGGRTWTYTPSDSVERT
jgi:hypothetical protein